MLPMLRTDFWRPVRRQSSPFNALWDDLDRLLPRRRHDGWSGESAFEPSLDVSEDEQAVRVRAELPGISPEHIHVEVNEDVLTLRGEKKEEKAEEDKGCRWTERRYGSFSRSIRLPGHVNRGKVQAHYKDGILTIELPKTEEAKPKQIKVETA